MNSTCPRCLSRNPATRNYIYNVTIGQSLLCDHPWHDQHKSHDENEELRLLREQVRDLIQLHLDERQEISLLKQIRDRLPLPSQLSSIKIKFGGNMAVGPVTLTVGQKTKATVVGFDQNGAVFNGPIPAPAFSLDNTTLDSGTDDGSGGFDVTSLTAGVANLTATVQGPNGPLTDTETITNVAVAQILSSIKIDFSTPTP